MMYTLCRQLQLLDQKIEFSGERRGERHGTPPVGISAFAIHRETAGINHGT
jgi:hypothetical protein